MHPSHFLALLLLIAPWPTQAWEVLSCGEPSIRWDLVTEEATLIARVRVLAGNVGFAEVRFLDVIRGPAPGSAAVVRRAVERRDPLEYGITVPGSEWWLFGTADEVSVRRSLKALYLPLERRAGASEARYYAGLWLSGPQVATALGPSADADAGQMLRDFLAMNRPNRYSSLLKKRVRSMCHRLGSSLAAEKTACSKMLRAEDDKAIFSTAIDAYARSGVGSCFLVLISDFAEPRFKSLAQRFTGGAGKSARQIPPALFEDDGRHSVGPGHPVQIGDDPLDLRRGGQDQAPSLATVTWSDFRTLVSERPAQAYELLALPLPEDNISHQSYRDFGYWAASRGGSDDSGNVVALATSRNPWVATGSRVLRLLRGDESVREELSRLSNEQKTEGCWAGLALARMGDLSAAERALECLREPPRHLMTAALRADVRLLMANSVVASGLPALSIGSFATQQDFDLMLALVRERPSGLRLTEPWLDTLVSSGVF